MSMGPDVPSKCLRTAQQFAEFGCWIFTLVTRLPNRNRALILLEQMRKPEQEQSSILFFLSNHFLSFHVFSLSFIFVFPWWVIESVVNWSLWMYPSNKCRQWRTNRAGWLPIAAIWHGIGILSSMSSWIPSCGWPDPTRREQHVVGLGSESAQLVPELRSIPIKRFVPKNNYSCFAKSKLLTVFRDAIIEELYICGINTGFCVFERWRPSIINFGPLSFPMPSHRCEGRLATTKAFGIWNDIFHWMSLLRRRIFSHPKQTFFESRWPSFPKRKRSPEILV